MKKQYILFDFDGVIVNTEPQNAHYLQETLKSFGVYMDHEELKGFIGVNSREKILHYLSRSKESVSWEMYQKEEKRWEIPMKMMPSVPCRDYRNYFNG
jgi:beta-phosphoglucomutase